KFGPDGPFDGGPNAGHWYQEESPPPPNTPMGTVYRCERCGRSGHEAKICAAPRRFEGNCSTCGGYGHTARRCLKNPNARPHAYILAAPPSHDD
ncbi:unnamed protein product, partial [Scytosiphon promiscuus]